MTVAELIKSLDKIIDKDNVIVFKDMGNGWTNIEVEETRGMPYIIPSSNREK